MREDYNPTMFSMSPQPVHSSQAPSPYYSAREYPHSNPSASPYQKHVPIAPDPAGLRQMNAVKRQRDEEEMSEFGQKKRKRAPSQSGPVELNEEEQLLLKLKEEENLPWKDIAVRFQTDLGKSYQVPALQMRFKRLRERMRTWTETDVSVTGESQQALGSCDLILILGSSARTSLRLLGEVPVRHHRRKDARLWRLGALACQVLRSQMGGDSPRARALQCPFQLPPRSLGYCQPRGELDKRSSQPPRDAVTISMRQRPADRFSPRDYSDDGVEVTKG